MTAQIIDGKAIAEQLKKQIAARVKALTNSGKRAPGLATVIVGNDPASEVYVKNKRASCDEVGFFSKQINLPQNISETDLLNHIKSLNRDPLIDGILVQLPLPEQINTDHVIDAIDPNKDVDGFHPMNIGLLALRRPKLQSCTPKGAITLLKQLNISLVGKYAVIVGASNIVGRPMSLALLMEKCTVTICHSDTRDLPTLTRQADILVVATGSPGLIKGDWVKPGAIVIDIGINRLPNGRLTGDVDFTAAKEIASFITPVPGGVGPMTVATLLENTLLAYEHN